MTLCLPELPARINASLNFVAILLGLNSLERKSTIHSLVPYDTTSTSNPTLFMPAARRTVSCRGRQQSCMRKGKKRDAPSTMDDERSMKEEP